MGSSSIAAPPVQRITVVQSIALALLSLLLWGMFDRVFAYSVLCGGLIAVIPQAYFAYRAFRWRGARSAQMIARTSYAAEIGKFMLSAAGFALVFASVRPIEGLAVFVGYLAMLVLQIIGSWRLLR